MHRLPIALAFALVATSAVAAEIASPPVPATLVGKAGVVCAKVSRAGRVVDVFLVTSTGDARADADLIDFVRLQRWPQAKKDEGGRDSWQPVPVAFGKAALPAAPEGCAPPARAR